VCPFSIDDVISKSIKVTLKEKFMNENVKWKEKKKNQRYSIKLKEFKREHEDWHLQRI
jgi:hypothetical protein